MSEQWLSDAELDHKQRHLSGLHKPNPKTKYRVLMKRRINNHKRSRRNLLEILINEPDNERANKALIALNERIHQEKERFKAY